MSIRSKTTCIIYFQDYANSIINKKIVENPAMAWFVRASTFSFSRLVSYANSGLNPPWGIYVMYGETVTISLFEFNTAIH